MPPVHARAPRPVAQSRWLLPDPLAYDGDVIGVGADLTPPTLVDAYRRGIFPWPHDEEPLPWFSPDPRGVLALDGVLVPRSLRRRIRSCRWETTIDVAFGDVIAACSKPRHEGDGVWISEDMVSAYQKLHDLGWAHSLEVLEGSRLVGGLYGVLIGAVFTGESMFHVEADASKVALVDLASRMTEAGAAFIDVQIPTAHLVRMGATPVRRAEYLRRLRAHRDEDIRLPIDRRPVSRLARG